MNATTLRYLSADELLRVAQPCTVLEQVLLDKLDGNEPAGDHDNRSMQELRDEISDLEDEINILRHDLFCAEREEKDDGVAWPWIDDVREIFQAIARPRTPQERQDAVVELEHLIQLKGIPTRD